MAADSPTGDIGRFASNRQINYTGEQATPAPVVAKETRLGCH